jgi:hypothetical protein
MKGRSVDKALPFLGFIGSATRFYKQPVTSVLMFAGRCRAKQANCAVQPWEMGINFPVL